jgi:hypothetical protein
MIGWYDDISTPYACARQRCVSDPSHIPVAPLNTYTFLKVSARVVLHEASDCTPTEAEVARPAAPPERGTERAATDPPERVWETFLELATETPKTAIKGGSFSFKAKAPDAMEHLVVDPAAVMEVPSLHDLSHGLTHMRGEMEELKAGIGKILERLGGAAPTTSGADPASAHSAPAPAATRLLFA